MIDVTESPVERPKKQRNNYSGKKKRHTQKAQVVAITNRQIICTAFGNGRKHDFKLFKQSKTFIRPDIKYTVDTGYQRIAKIYEKVDIPKKRSKKNPLTKEDKKQNKDKSSKRVLVENIIIEIKIFRIIAEKYRNRRRRFGLRFNLIAAIYNVNLSVKLFSEEVYWFGFNIHNKRVNVLCGFFSVLKGCF